jgi:hypothetical protein
LREANARSVALYLFDLRGGAGVPIYVVPHDNRSTTQRFDSPERNRVASIDRPAREVHEDQESCCRSAHKKEFFIADRPI